MYNQQTFSVFAWAASMKQCFLMQGEIQSAALTAVTTVLTAVTAVTDVLTVISPILTALFGENQ